MKSVIQPLAKRVSIPLGLTGAASAADAGIHKKILGSGLNTLLIISNDEMKDIFKILKSLEDSGLLLEGISEAIKNEPKGKRRISKYIIRYMLLGASLLGNMLAGKSFIRAVEGTAKVGYRSKRSSFKKIF